MSETPKSQPYRVLARKYRPTDFTSLIGQEAMVQTLSNAIASGRLAHAFVLTGVRGVGKTSTARIIARALNCIGADGTGGPTVSPCGVCEHCVSIAEDRHVDVIEMDAASRTGVDDIRELIDGVLYRPVTARYKIYIIDEVHMLSRNAFNALLKTLEEPPEHVKFIFATTEIRKVPVTVLSRCQRFDLRRVKFDVLSAHFASVAEREGARISAGAVALIARAADGSVRDGLSLLDQAIAHGGPESGITEDLVRDMLGVAERVQVFDLFEELMKGEIAAALARFDTMYASGADPSTVLQDLAELTHWLTRLKVAPDAAESTPTSDLDLTRGRDFASRIPMAALARAWQMLLKGLSEVRNAPSAAQAAEMVMVRIAYAADLPSPADLVGDLSGGGKRAAPASVPQAAPAASEPAPVRAGAQGPAHLAAPAPAHAPPQTPAQTAQRADAEADGRFSAEAHAGRRETSQAAAPAAMSRNAPATSRTNAPAALALKPLHDPRTLADETTGDPGMPATFEQAVAMFAARGEPLLHAYLVNNAHLVRFERGKIAIRVAPEAPRDLAMRMSRCLNEWTGRAWFVEDSREDGAPTLQQQRDAAALARREEALAHPLVRMALEAFPGAEVTEVRTVAEAPADGGAPDSLAPAPDEFEDMDPEDFDPAETDEDFI
ncbi:MAG: DNA polymerase III subunit gamma/tau [Rhodospirillaceae bacterium]